MAHVFVKICGLRTTEDVTAAVEAGVDAIGFMLSPSPRQVDTATARELAAGVPAGVLTVAVIHGVAASDEIATLAADAGVDAVQLHGAYEPATFAALRTTSPFRLIRAVSATGGQSLRCGAHGEDLLIVDSPAGGSGTAWDWRGGAGGTGRWLLAGGLRPDNVAEAIDLVQPWGVDVSSGVERVRGEKDPALIHAFVQAARR